MTPEDRAKAIAKLEAARVPDAANEVRRLWGVAFPRRYVDYDEAQDGTALKRFREFVDRRAAREPFSHISGLRHFYKLAFKVTPDVLDPRPETETLVEIALQEPFSRVLDLGTGSGCIIVSLLAERLDATGVGTDISPEGILVAGENAYTHNVADRIILPLSEWYDDIGGRFDLIVSNPPYISADEMAGLSPEVRDHEPRIALTDEADGLTAYSAIAAGAPHHLAPGGRLLVEIGPTQAADVSAIFDGADLDVVAVHPDLDGRDRVVEARLKSA